MYFNQVLKKHRSVNFSERDKGDRFERLIQAYLYTDSKYAPLFKTIWLWNEFPYNNNFGGQDIGIDIVALTNSGDYWAIQCKCYQDDARIDKPEVDGFLSTSGRTFKNEKGEVKNFSTRLWVSTTNNWTSKANETLQNQNPPVVRLNLHDLQEAAVDWEKIDKGIFGIQSREAKKELFPHQKEALQRCVEYFKTKNRGKIIMACGTGKTFASLRIAEEIVPTQGSILFLVPSIALLGQTLREWTADAKEQINAICICSDAEVSKEKVKNEDVDTYSVVDLALPASTNINSILKQFEDIEMNKKDGLTVVFSTYQSIDVISRTQKKLGSIGSKYSSFDLIVCDEAHRTTGVTLLGDDESAFVKVHDNEYLSADKRLYMTATPRLYGEESKSKAAQTSAVLCSMDDEKLYGSEIYRIGFGEAVERSLLSDYKVLILTLSENDITPELQRIIQNDESEISTDDVSKLIGCVNAMSKHILGDEVFQKATDTEPMRRAVAFCQNIKVSKKISETFNSTAAVYKESVPEIKQQNLVNLNSQHIDGTMSATERDRLMAWLKSEPDDPKESRVLTNVRCLSEGVDVPSLDAVMFLSAKNSQIDVVQSVGRVMRKSPGKTYGYIIIPVVIPADVEPEKALDDNERYKVVWTVLNALRAHDDRFNAIVNKIDLNKKRPKQILVGHVDNFGDGNYGKGLDDPNTMVNDANQMTIYYGKLQSIIYAKLVQKVGDRRYWEQWAKSVADIAERQIKRITNLVKSDGKHQKSFQEFLIGLQKNINPSINEIQAIEMLSQHIITKPVFEALFEDYSFVKNNAVSISMQDVLVTIEANAVDKEDQILLEAFYSSVRKRAEGIDNAAGKQKIIIELYDKFFKSAFPKMVEQLGIVYTPVEVVDFIIKSVNAVLIKEFGRTLSDKGVNILDPFTGTGTFITRLLQSGIIKDEDMQRKYNGEIFANEYVLLAYYIAAVNIENTFHDLMHLNKYESFEGIALTDTFQLSENNNDKLFSESLAENSERVIKQVNTPLKVIIGNPPYSVGQKSANDNAQNQKYPTLDKRISETYAAATKATNKNSLYDSYIKAFRWSTDRLSAEGGIIGFVSNGAWIDGTAQDGFRKMLEKEFTTIYVFNLRGNARTSGELRRKEAGNVFKEGSRTPISITILVKNPNLKTGKASIFYHDIGDYLSREQKLAILEDFTSIENNKIPWKELMPNEFGDWINLRNSAFDNLIAITTKEKYSKQKNDFFLISSNGLKTQRDAWCYNSFTENLIQNISDTITFYNSEVKRFTTSLKSKKEFKINYDSSKISWTESLVSGVHKNKKISFDKSHIRTAIYRPFYKQVVYYDKELNERTYQFNKIFPIDSPSCKNIVLCVPGAGDKKDFSVLIANTIPDLGFNSASQCFPLYFYEKKLDNSPSLFLSSDEESYIRHDAISDFILKRAHNQYGSNVIKEDIFYYVYGILHSVDYREKFANDLKKMLPRLPLVEDINDFWLFSKSGRELADLHLNYEKVPECKGAKVSGTQHGDYRVTKMKFIKKGQKDTIIYNDFIKIENIPDKAYNYVINGRSAIEWLIDRYQIKKDKDSGIVNDPNDWCKEVKNPRYILDLLLSIINVSVMSVDIVEKLPKLNFDSDI